MNARLRDMQWRPQRPGAAFHTLLKEKGPTVSVPSELLIGDATKPVLNLRGVTQGLRGEVGAQPGLVDYRTPGRGEGPHLREGLKFLCVGSGH